MPTPTYLGALPGTPEYYAATKDAVFQGGAKYFTAKNPNTNEDIYLTRVGDYWQEVSKQEAETGDLGTSSQRFANLGPGSYNIEWINKPNLVTNPDYAGGQIAFGASQGAGVEQSIASQKPLSEAEKTALLSNNSGTVKAAGLTNLSQGVYIPNEQALQGYREELSKAGVPQSDWGKYISAPDASGKLYYRQPATLTSPTGQKKVVATGSQEANDLFKAGWSLGTPFNDAVISSSVMVEEEPINIGGSTTKNSYQADSVAGGFNSTISSTEKEIDRLQKLLITEAPETDNSKKLSDLIASLDPDSLTGRNATQLAEEEKRGIEQKITALNSKTAELKRKSDEINALTASYNLANQTEEGKPQTLSRLQGAQAQNYKMYLAQKNSLTADAAFIQSDLLAMQNDLKSAQEAADRAVDLKFADKEDEYNATLAKINILKPQVEKEEEQYLNSIKLDLEEQLTKLAEEKSNLKTVQEYKIKAIGLKLSADVVNQIGQAKTVEEAYKLLVDNSPKKFETPETKEVGGNLYQFNTKTGTWDLVIRKGLSDGDVTKTENQQAREAIQGDMDAILGSDGYVDTKKYAQVRQNVAINEPDQLSWFDNAYPKEQILNPNDETALKYLQTPTQVIESSQNLNSVLKKYKDGGYSRKDIENLLKKKYNSIPAPAQKWLDDNFDKEPSWWNKLWN